MWVGGCGTALSIACQNRCVVRPIPSMVYSAVAQVGWPGIPGNGSWTELFGQTLYSSVLCSSHLSCLLSPIRLLIRLWFHIGVFSHFAKRHCQPILSKAFCDLAYISNIVKDVNRFHNAAISKLCPPVLEFQQPRWQTIPLQSTRHPWSASYPLLGFCLVRPTQDYFTRASRIFTRVQK